MTRGYFANPQAIPATKLKRMLITILMAILSMSVSLCAQVLPGAGSTKSKDPLAGLPEVNEYPQEAVVVEHFYRSYRFENDGSSVSKTRVVYKVQSEAGVQAVGVLQLAYN